MRGLRSILIVVAALYLLAIVLSAFLLPEPLPGWAVFAIWLLAGALLAGLARPTRWWVVLGFLCLGAAWVEAAQAVWFERRGSATDVILGCLASAVGVAAAVAVRALCGRRATRGVSPRTSAAPRHR